MYVLWHGCRFSGLGPLQQQHTARLVDFCCDLQPVSRSYKGLCLPRGSKYPNSRVLGPKNHTLNGFGDLKPCYLGTWTLWVRVSMDISLRRALPGLRALGSLRGKAFRAARV